MSIVDRVLGIDPGKYKTGVAIGQSLTQSATPLAIIHKPLVQLQPEHFRCYIEEWQPARIVVGKPELADGRKHPMADDIDRLVSLLEKQFSLPVHTYNEYLSSHEARQRQPGKKEIDDIAAAVILESWFGSGFNG